jgi:hypothetical protein
MRVVPPEGMKRATFFLGSPDSGISLTVEVGEVPK